MNICRKIIFIILYKMAAKINIKSTFENFVQERNTNYFSSASKANSLQVLLKKSYLIFRLLATVSHNKLQ